jgi:putative membrane protein
MSDANILAAMHEGDSAEVALAQYVGGATKNTSVKSFAKLLERDHSKGMTQVSSTATKAGITPQMPAGDTTSKALSNAMGRMQSLSGNDLDTAFVNYEVADHQKDIADAKQMATAAQNASVKAAVQMELPELQRHLNAAEKLSSQLAAKNK